MRDGLRKDLVNAVCLRRKQPVPANTDDGLGPGKVSRGDFVKRARIIRHANKAMKTVTRTEIMPSDDLHVTSQKSLSPLASLGEVLYRLLG